MKKIFIFFLLVFTCFSVFAQVKRGARIFVPPVAGEGLTGDSEFFYSKLNFELVYQYREMARSEFSADFLLRGSIVPFTGQHDVDEAMGYASQRQLTPTVTHFEPPQIEVRSSPIPPRPSPSVRNTRGRREFFSWEKDNAVSFFDSTGEFNEQSAPVIIFTPPPVIDKFDDYVFFLELVESGTNRVLAKQYIIYQVADVSIGDLLAVIVFNMLSAVPDVERTTYWRDNWMFLETGVFWAPRFYYSNDNSFIMLNFGYRLAAEIQFLDFMSASFGFQLIQERIPDKTTGSGEFRDIILEIPFAIKYIYDLSDAELIEPYAGISLNFSLQQQNELSPLSWFAGVQYGANIGPGILYIDPRFSMDFGKSKIDETKEYFRYMFQVGLGYKMGFFPKR